MTPFVLSRFTLVQTCYQIGTVLMMSIGILAATPLAPDPNLVSLPLALAVVGTFSMLFPASRLMNRIGRKRGLAGGVVLGAAGVTLIIVGLTAASFVSVCLGFLIYGFHQAFLGYLRFTAMEAAGPEKAASALSWILVGGIPAAILGPDIGLWGKSWPGIPEYSGAFMILLGVLLVQLLVVYSLPTARAVAPVAASGESRPWPVRLSDPSLWLAIVAGCFSYGLMVMLMAAAPVAMHTHGHDAAASALVLQGHVLGMYVPSFFSGVLVKRFGPRKLMAAGVGVFALELFTALQGTSFLPFFLALTLLGIGWNFLYVGATNLLVTRYRTSEKAGVQAFNDSIMYIFATVSTFGAGAWERSMGWNWLNYLALPFLAVIVVLLLVSRRLTVEVK